MFMNTVILSSLHNSIEDISLGKWYSTQSGENDKKFIDADREITVPMKWT